MPYRVPGGNLVGRLIGLGNLDKLERERDIRQMQRMANRPFHDETNRRALQGFNSRAGMRLARCPIHGPFIPNGLPHDLERCLHEAEESRLGFSGTRHESTTRRGRQADIDDWRQEHVMSYYLDHEEGIERFKRLLNDLTDVRQREGHNLKWWVRKYHEHIEMLQAMHEQRTRDFIRHGGTARGHRFGDDIPYVFHTERHRHEDEMEEEFDD